MWEYTFGRLHVPGSSGSLVGGQITMGQGVQVLVLLGHWSASDWSIVQGHSESMVGFKGSVLEVFLFGAGLEPCW